MDSYWSLGWCSLSILEPGSYHTCTKVPCGCSPVDALTSWKRFHRLRPAYPRSRSRRGFEEQLQWKVVGTGFIIFMTRAERSKSGWRRWLRTVRQIWKCIRRVYSMLFSLFLAVKRKVYFEWRPQDRSPSLDSLTLSLALKSASKNLQGAWKTFASGLLRAFYSY